MSRIFQMTFFGTINKYFIHNSVTHTQSERLEILHTIPVLKPSRTSFIFQNVKSLAVENYCNWINMVLPKVNFLKINCIS